MENVIYLPFFMLIWEIVHSGFRLHSGYVIWGGYEGDRLSLVAVEQNQKINSNAMENPGGIWAVHCS